MSRIAARRYPHAGRGPPVSERTGARQRLAAVGHLPALARDAARASTGAAARGSRASASTPGGATTGCCGEHGDAHREPRITYRDARTDGVMEQVFERVSRERIYATTGIQFLWFNTLYQLFAACRTTPASIAAAHRFATIPDLLNYWLSGQLAPSTRSRRRRSLSTRRRERGRRTARRARSFPTRLLPQIVEPGTVLGRFSSRRGDRRWPARQSSRRRVTTRLRPSRRLRPATTRRSSAPARGRCSAPSSPRPIITPRALELELHQRRRRLRHDAAAEEHRRPVAAAVVPPVVGGVGARLRLRRAGRRRPADERPFQSLLDPDIRGFLQSRRHAHRDRRLLPADRAAGARRTAGVSRAPSWKASRSSTAPCSSRSRRSPAGASTRFVSSAAARATGC